MSDDEVRSCGDEQWFLPHFPVVRSDRSTTKVRIVFDAAAQLNGTSLNDRMHTGQKLQNDLVAILIRFCLNPIAVAADVSEMSLQISIKPEDRRYLRFTWQSASGEDVQVFEFLRLVFGLRASPYLAGKALLETARQFGAQYDPDVSEVVSSNFYVDDMQKSFRTDKEAIRICTQLIKLLPRGGFKLRKWISNSESFLASIPVEDRATVKTVTFSEEGQDGGVPMQKTLGIVWLVEQDCFTYIYQDPGSIVFTKRGVLRRLASLFAPRGHLTPFTIRGRIQFQELCIADLGWDEELPAKAQSSWQQWFDEFKSLAEVRVARRFREEQSTGNMSLHVFTDASEMAYAAAVYLRAENEDGSFSTSLVMSKARPTPVKRRSVPMLELQGAVLGARLGKYVAGVLDIYQLATYSYGLTP